MKLAWLSDIHLDFLPESDRSDFYKTLVDYDGVIITGDISNATSLNKHLKEMGKVVKNTIFYVLGNHDFYGSSVSSVRRDLPTDTNLRHLGYYEGGFFLTEETYLCGVDGWADARSGNFDKSPVQLNDEYRISDLKYAKAVDGRPGLKAKMRELSNTDSKLLVKQIENTLQMSSKVKNILIATHVPPFPEASRYQGKESCKDFQPFFCNLGLGRELLKIAKKYPGIDFTLYCGHTHDRCSYDKLSNLKIKVAGATYNKPEIQEIIEL